MSWSKLLVVALAGALAAGPALAQDDDELMQLSPTKKKAKPKPKPRPKPARPAPAPVTSNDDELAPLTPSKGELVLKAAPGTNTRRTKVTIDEREVGTLPVSAQSLSAGDHMVVVRAPGHVTWSKKIAIHANKPTELTVTLEANAAIVSVSTDAPGAQVAINGKAVGTAPIEELEVPPGPTTITVRKEGYKDSNQTLRLIAGKEYPLSVKLGAPTVATEIVATGDRPENPNLTPTPTPNEDLGIGTTIEDSSPIYTRWYFWAGAVAVVAAVAVGTTVGVSSNQPRPLGEEGICGPTGCDMCVGFDCGGPGLSPSGFAPFKF